ncbi:MAG: hypothetical protein AAF721_35005 [Myxococcota bacterium]
MSVHLSTATFRGSAGGSHTAAVVEFVGDRVLDDEQAQARVEERVEAQFVDFVREQPQRPCVLVLRMDGPRGRWLARSKHGDDGVDAICLSMVRALLPTYTALFSEGIDAIVHTDLPRPIATSLRRASYTLGYRSEEDIELTPQRWLFQNLSSYLIQPYDLVMDRVLPPLVEVLARRARYVRTQLPDASAADGVG